MQHLYFFNSEIRVKFLFKYLIKIFFCNLTCRCSLNKTSEHSHKFLLKIKCIMYIPTQKKIFPKKIQISLKTNS